MSSDGLLRDRRLRCGDTVRASGDRRLVSGDKYERSRHGIAPGGKFFAGEVKQMALAKTCLRSELYRGNPSGN